MGPRRVAHSKEACFDELHLSWAQLGEIIATWWEIRAGPCCAAQERLQLWKRSRFSSPANSAAHTSVTERATTKQDTHTDNTININSPPLCQAGRAAAVQWGGRIPPTTAANCTLLEFQFWAATVGSTKRTFCFLLEATGETSGLKLRSMKVRAFFFLLPSSRRPCNSFPARSSSGRANYRPACPDRYTVERKGGGPAG